VPNREQHARQEELLERAHQIARHYTISTGIPVRVLTDDADTRSFCEYCFAGRTDSSKESCLDLHRYSARQAERFGGSYMYFCHASLLYWASPILHDGVMIASFTAGPALILDKEEIIEELSHREHARPAAEISLSLMDIPSVSPERSKSLAEMLLMCAGWVNEQGDSVLIESDAYQKQQAKISEYIHQLKSHEDQNIPRYPIELEEELYSAISQGKKQQAQRILNEILGNVFFSSGSKLELISFRVTELIVLLSRAAMEGGADPEETLSMNFTYLRQVGQFRSLDSLSYWLSKVLNEYSSLVFDIQSTKHVDRLERTLHYIHTHYTEKISLEDASAYAAISPTYFSKIFKEEIGLSFTRYINQIRINHAKTLLKTTPCTLIEVAGLVGFEDQSYFSRVFKQEVGISPGKYRSNSIQWRHDKSGIHS
jgi:two-component system, response regulator YesN